MSGAGTLRLLSRKNQENGKCIIPRRKEKKMDLSTDQKKWADEVWERLDQKLSRVAVRSRSKLPFKSADGIHNDMSKVRIHCWTNGFWPGLMWLMYAGTGREEYRKTAECGEALLDAAFDEPEKLTHDVGFLWKLASGPDYLLTGNHKAWQRMRRAADHLMGRYNPVGEYIRAWDWGSDIGERAGWTIIDTMMNLPLLYWASDENHDPRFRFAAMKHADKTLESHIRPDGSVRHIAIHDPQTGVRIDEAAGQGIAVGSTWSRGQAWAIYGYVLSYLHTGTQVYLDTAKSAAHYFIANVCGDWLPRCDFRSPEEPLYYDCSAGACAACGMLEIAKAVPEQEKRLYLNAAFSMLTAIEQKFADWSENTDFLIGGVSGAYGTDNNIHIIYADYFFAEAVYKLKGFEPLFW